MKKLVILAVLLSSSLDADLVLAQNANTIGTVINRAPAAQLPLTSSDRVPVTKNGATPLYTVPGDYFTKDFSVKDYGAKCDGHIIYSQVEITSGSKLVKTGADPGSPPGWDTFAHYNFTSADVGAVINFQPALVNGHSASPLTNFTTVIASVSGGDPVLSDNATFTSSTYQWAAARWYHTVDTTAIQAAINAAHAAGGGAVVFPQGVCVSGNLTLYDNVMIRGTGVGGSTIMLANGSNSDLFTGYQFSALTGSSIANGVGNWGFQDVQLDGNRGTNTGSGQGTPTGVGAAIRVFGYQPYMRNVLVSYFAGDGMYTEWNSGGGSPLDAPGGMEFGFHDLKFAYNAGYGWVDNGPHDSKLSYVYTFANGLGGILAGGNSSPLDIDHYHGYAEGGYDLDLNGATIGIYDADSESGSRIQGFDYKIYDSNFGANGLTLGVGAGPPVYRVHVADSTVNVLNNVTGSGFFDVWTGNGVNSYAGAAYLPDYAFANFNMPNTIKGTSGDTTFSVAHGPSWPYRIQLDNGSDVTLSWGGADHEVLNADGSITLLTLPTSCSARPTGTLWNNSGALGVCP